MTQTDQILYQVITTLKQEFSSHDINPVAKMSLKAEVTNLFQENFDHELIEDRLMEILEEANLYHLSQKIKSHFKSNN